MNRTYSDAGIVEGSTFVVANSRPEAQGCPRRGPSRGILRGCVTEYSRRRSLRDAADCRRCGVLETRIVEGVRILDDLGIRHQHQVFTCGNRFRYRLAVQGPDQTVTTGGTFIRESSPEKALMTLNIFFYIIAFKKHKKNRDIYFYVPFLKRSDIYNM